MATRNEHVQLSGGLARVHQHLLHEFEDEYGYRPTHPRIYSHLLEHYEGPLDLPDSDSE